MFYVSLFYAAVLVLFCVGTLSDSDKPQTRIDYFFAVILPIGCVAGILGFWFLPDTVGAAWCFLPVWILSTMGFLWEIKDIQRAYVDQGVGGAILGVFLLLVIFGPGILAGVLWMQKTIL